MRERPPYFMFWLLGLFFVISFLIIGFAYGQYKTIEQSLGESQVTHANTLWNGHPANDAPDVRFLCSRRILGDKQNFSNVKKMG